MKNGKKITAFALCLLCVLSPLTSCGKKEAEDPIETKETTAAPASGTAETEAHEPSVPTYDESETMPPLVTGDSVSATDYKIIRADLSSAGTKSVASNMYKMLTKLLGSTSIGTDSDDETEHEIILGKTSRKGYENICDGLNYGDWYITSDGKNIVIAGGSDEALAIAANFLLENLIDVKAKSFVLPDGEYRYTAPITFKKLTVDGVDISEFKILNKSLDTEFKDFSAAIRTRVIGKPLENANPDFSDVGDGGHYIVLDGSGLIEDEYSITVENGDIIIKGSRNSLAEAKKTFLGEFTKGLGAEEYNLTSADNKTYSTGKKAIPYTKDTLMQVMEDVYDSKEIIIGEEVQGNTADCIKSAIDLFVKATDVYPGIMGIDLACYGIDLMKHDDAWWSSYICDIVDYCSEGGILTASSHFANPSGNTMGSARCRGRLGYDDTKEGYEKAFEDLLTEGTEYNRIWKEELAADARFLKALGDNGVTVLWRPLHESNGGWFWFCTTQNKYTLDASYLKRMWIYIYDYYVNELGLTNLVWNYGPNTSGNVTDKPGSTMSPWYCYPGDEYVDMVGVDWYTSGNFEIMQGDNYLTLIEKTGKIGAITEFGTAGAALASDGQSQEELFDSMALYGTLLELEREDYNFVYLLTWGSKWGIPAMGKGREFMKTDIAIGRSEVKAMFDKISKK